MLTIPITLKDYTLILAYEPLMTHLCCGRTARTTSAGSF